MIDDAKLKGAWAIYEKTKVIFFVTYDGNHFFCRPMSGILSGGDTIYAATFRDSKKVAHTQSFGKAGIFLYDAESHHYACLSGPAEVRDDKEWREKLWRDDWTQYFKGIDDPNFVYIKLKVENIDYVTNV